MRGRIVVALLAFIVATPIAWTAHAQNLNSYQSISNPYLFLLREPAIHGELKLTEQQRHSLATVNDAIDPGLLAMQNQPPDKQRETMPRLIAETQSRLERVLSDRQRERLSQIMLQVRGVQSMVTPKVAERLQLSADQVSRIEQTLKTTQVEVEKIVKQIQDGEPRQPLVERAMKLREKENGDIFRMLSSTQQKELVALIGPQFDQSKLGRARFKAPELIAGDDWINSKQVKIADLRGKVVAVHFWAFG